MKTKKPPPIPEREIMASGTIYLRSMGWIVHRRNVGAITLRDNYSQMRTFRANSPGMSDTWGDMPDGRHFELEYKATGKQPTDLQRAWLIRMNSRPNTVAFWVDSTRALELVANHLRAGGSVEYTGRWADYDLV